MTIGLYELVGGARNRELTSKDIALCIKPEMTPETRERLLAWKEELEFWEEYRNLL